MRNRIDWGALVANLLSTGVTQVELARLCDMTQPAISRLSGGVTVDPPHSAGAALVRLYESRFPDRTTPLLRDHGIATEPAAAEGV